MRELAVTIRFTSPCLGNVRRQYRQRGKIRHYFVLPRTPDRTQVVFMPSWWQATLRKAAEILCRHQKDVLDVRFAPAVQGTPRSIPEFFYRRHQTPFQYSRHEAFYAGDEITVTCVVPATISDEDMVKLLTYAGKYCGMSPAHPNKFGFYDVVSVVPTGDFSSLKPITVLSDTPRENVDAAR